MRLSRISFVNWHTYEGFQDIEVEGHLAIVGNNGAGKSTLLDLMQIVLTGASSTYYRLNAKADDAGRASGRTVASYCLGALGGDRYERDECLTYVVLGFSDPTRSLRPVSIGLALEARKGDGAAKVVARFIAKGRMLDSGDLTADALDGVFPKVWGDFQRDMRKEFGEDFFFENTSAIRFVREWMMRLVPSQAQTTEAAQSLLRAIVKGITLRTEVTATEFIRQFVLPERPIRIRELRDSIATYKRVQDVIVTLRRKLESLRGLSVRIDAYAEAVARQSVEGWIARKGRVLHAKAMLDANIAEKSSLDAKLAETDADRIEANRDIAETERALRDQENSLAAVEARTGRQDKVGLVALLGRESEMAERDLDGRRKAFRSLGSSLAMLPEVAGVDAALVSRTAKQVDMVTSASHPDGIDESEAMVVAIVPALRERLRTWRSAATREQGRRSDRLEAIDRELTALESEKGGTASVATDALLRRLRRAGMDPRPLCDLLEIVDPEWRSAAEGLLGRDRETVFVDREHFVEADRILRSEGGVLRGAVLASMPKISDSPGPVVPGTFASLFHTERKAAMVFVQRRHGDVRLCSDMAEFDRPGRALMRDGYYDDGLSRRHRGVGPSDFRIGRAARKDRIVALREDRETLDAEIAAAEVLERCGECLATAMSTIENMTDTSGSIVLGIRERSERKSMLEDEIARIDGEDDGGLKDRISASRKLLANMRKGLAELESRAGGEATRRRIIEGTLKLGDSQPGSLVHYNVAAGIFREKVAEIGLPEPFRHEYRRRFEETSTDVSSNASDFVRMRALADLHLKVATDAELLLGGASERVIDARNRAKGALRTHLDHHVASALVGPGSDLLAEVRPWLAVEIPQIEGNELREYEDQAATASLEASRIFRAEFVHALTSRVREMKVELGTLNKLLRDFPFHRERYSFVPSAESRFEAILRFAELPEGFLGVASPMDLLFRDDVPEDHPHYATLREVRRILEDPDIDPDEFEDYRNYHSFEIRLDNLETGNVSSWSERIGTGSGAEKQIPIYVAVAAALANAFGTTDQKRRLNRGIALAIFDEVFAKFDGGNRQMMMSFLDNLGLQLVVAAPLDTQIGLQEHMDTMIEVGRWKDRSHIHAVQIGERTRKALREIDPALLTDEQAAMLHGAAVGA